MNATKNITFIPTDRRTKNAVIRKICKENNISDSDIYCNEYYNYMEYSNKISITLLTTVYKGVEYYFKYKDGCFNAYMFAEVADYTYSINEYNHYILYDKEGLQVFKIAGYAIGHQAKELYITYLKQTKK
jgi:hypothetical protein